MRSLLLFILLFLMLGYSSFAQNDLIEQEKVEEFNRELDSLKESLDDEYDEEDESGAAYDENEYVQDKEQYSAADYEPELREVDKQSWEKLKKDKRFKYKKKVRKKRKKKKRNSKSWFDGLSGFFNSGLVKLILYILLAAFLGFIVYLFIKNNNISFKKNIKDESVVQEDPWEDVRRFEDWELALRDAVNSGDYRLATRIYYLHTLHLLDKMGTIKYRDDKTNWFYVQKLFATELHDDFKELTKSFDYIWYGEYQIDQEQFDLLQTQFQNFHARIKE